MRRRVAHAFVASVIALVAGCATAPLSVSKGLPEPNLALAPSQQSIKLEIADGVPDAFAIPDQNGIPGGRARDWHATLVAGFQAFGDAYRLVAESGVADLTLRIDEASLEYIPAAVNGQGGVVSAAAQVRYKLELIDASGAVHRSAGTGLSRKTSSVRAEATALAASAVETMYETAAKELFGDNGGTPRTEPSTSPQGSERGGTSGTP